MQTCMIAPHRKASKGQTVILVGSPGELFSSLEGTPNPARADSRWLFSVVSSESEVNVEVFIKPRAAYTW